MFLIPKYKDLQGEVANQSGLSGRYKLSVMKPDGRIRMETEWFNNIILNTGLDVIGVYNYGRNYLGHCHVGTGTSTPIVTQTALDNLIYSASYSSRSSSAQGSAPYYGKKIVTYTFAAADADHTLSEIGVSDGSGIYFSRALIVDGSGNPTTISLVTGEILIASYELRIYPGSVDGDYAQTGVNIGGSSYTVTSRASHVTDSGYWGNGLGAGIPNNFTGINVYDGALGAVTSGPTGNTLVSSSASDGSYSSSSFNINETFGFNISSGNFVTGISAAIIASTDAPTGAYQYSFSPAIPKDSSKTLSLTFNLSWARV